MKLVLGSILCFAATSACAIQMSEDQRIMALIENTVDLPKGSNPMNQYSRNYAFGPEGKVTAIYATPYEPVGDVGGNYGCDVMLEDLSSRPCNEEEIAEIRQQDEVFVTRFGVADQSRWFDDYRELPIIMDGGCSQITIMFDRRSQEIESVDCNGSA